ncbi:hypothetical protein E2320_010764 [Naja naja]|nr:hypothetical protein E2320_010764 [Naja naja]
MDCYKVMYPENMTQIHAIAANLEKAASKWLVSLHDDDALELINLNEFMQALREHFQDTQQPVMKRPVLVP